MPQGDDSIHSAFTDTRPSNLRTRGRVTTPAVHVIALAPPQATPSRTASSTGRRRHNPQAIPPNIASPDPMGFTASMGGGLSVQHECAVTTTTSLGPLE